MKPLRERAANAVNARIARLGTTVLQINQQRVQQGGIGTASLAKLTMRDVDALNTRAPNVASVNMQQDWNLAVVWRNKNIKVQVTGTAPNFLEVRGFSIDLGARRL